MSECPQHKETLMLDIFGELNQNRSDAWKQHLSNCPGCMTERDALSQTLKIVKTTLDAPSLGEVEAAAMRERVIRDLTIGAKNPRERKRPFFFSRAFVPVLASACVLLMATGFIASKFLTGPEISKGNRLTVLQEQLPADDLAIINNLDLLTNLDALNKLARAIDRSQPPSRHNNVQGKNSHGKKPIFS
jgi:anti-sigma factor RsiW